MTPRTEKTEPLILIRAGHRRRIAALMACIAVSGSVVVGAAVRAGAVPSSSAPRAWVRSAHSVPTLPKGSRAIGLLARATTVHAEVLLKGRDPDALDNFDTAVSTPGSPSFRHYLAPGAFAGTFGPLPSTIASVRQWLAGRGLTLGPTSGDGLIVPVSGTAAQVGQAFDVGLERYRLPSGRVVRAPDAEPLVPGALAADLDGVTGLDDLSVPVPQLVRNRSTVSRDAASSDAASSDAASSDAASSDAASSDAASSDAASSDAASSDAASSDAVPGSGVEAHAPGPTPTPGCETTIQSDGNSAGGLTVDQLASAYSFASLYSGNEGAGVSVGVYELEPFLQSDINAFKNCYSPPSVRR